MGTADILVRALLVVVMVGGGAAVIGTTRAAASGRLRRNGWSGIRLPSTLASEEAWAAAHRAGRMPMELSGWALLLGAIAPAVSAAMVTITLGVLSAAAAALGLMLWGAALGVRAARAVAKS